MSMKAMARTMSGDSGYLQYKIVSGFYGHLSNHSLEALKSRNGKDGVTNILGPFETQIPTTLHFAMDAMLRTTRYFEVIMKEKRWPHRLNTAHRKLTELLANRSYSRHGSDSLAGVA
jgi:hypothetical protein